MEGLLWIHARWKVLVLIDALSHALEHVLRNLTHLIHVRFLLRALCWPRHGIKRTLLRWELGKRLVGCGRKTACDGIVLTGTAFGTEHAVCWNEFSTGPAVHGLPSHGIALATLPKGLRQIAKKNEPTIAIRRTPKARPLQHIS